jgi:hypothetical protein
MSVRANVTLVVRRSSEEKILAGTMQIGELAFATDTKSLFSYDGVAKHLLGRAIVDSYVHRPAPGISGRFFYSEDTSQLFLDNVSTWIEVMTKKPSRAPIFMSMGS